MLTTKTTGLRAAALATGFTAALAGFTATLAGGCQDGVVLPEPLHTTATTGAGGGDATTAATTGNGGAGGAGGATTTATATSTGTGGGGGAGGGTSVTCLDAAAYADVLTLKDAALCAVHVYTASEMLGYQAPSYGSHGGPLTLRPGMNGSVDLVRWSPPAADGALTKKEDHVDAMIPAGAFTGAQAVDLPFFGWTAFAWTGAFPSTLGEIILAKGAAVDVRYAVNGAFAIGGLGASAEGRLLYSGLSKLGDAMTGGNGLYAADTCGTPAMPSLLPGMDPTCKAPIAVSAWGGASGPVAVDHDGNAFAVMSDPAGGMQEARAFGAASIARGAAATDGDVLFTLPGFGASLAAIAPAGKDPGLVAFQPFDGMTFLAGDVVVQRYAVSSGKIAPSGKPTPLLTTTKANASVYVMADDQSRLWAGIDTAAGATYVVFARKP